MLKVIGLVYILYCFNCHGMLLFRFMPTVEYVEYTFLTICTLKRSCLLSSNCICLFKAGSEHYNSGVCNVYRQIFQMLKLQILQWIKYCKLLQYYYSWESLVSFLARLRISWLKLQNTAHSLKYKLETSINILK